MDADDAREAATGLLRLLTSEPGVRAAVGRWARADVPLRDEWLRMLPAESVGVLAEGALDAWVREQTGGLLDGMAAPVGPEALLVLTVRTTWKEPFEDAMFAARAGPWAKQTRHGLSRSGTDLDQLAVVPMPLTAWRSSPIQHIGVCSSGSRESTGHAGSGRLRTPTGLVSGVPRGRSRDVARCAIGVARPTRRSGGWLRQI